MSAAGSHSTSGTCSSKCALRPFDPRAIGRNNRFGNPAGRLAEQHLDAMDRLDLRTDRARIRSQRDTFSGPAAPVSLTVARAQEPRPLTSGLPHAHMGRASGPTGRIVRGQRLLLARPARSLIFRRAADAQKTRLMRREGGYLTSVAISSRASTARPPAEAADRGQSKLRCEAAF